MANGVNFLGAPDRSVHPARVARRAGRSNVQAGIRPPNLNLPPTHTLGIAAPSPAWSEVGRPMSSRTWYHTARRTFGRASGSKRKVGGQASKPAIQSYRLLAGFCLGVQYGLCRN